MTVRILATALAITLIQLAVALACTGQSRPLDAWGALVQFDGGWFRSVVEHGYHFPPEPTLVDPGNVAFFPGYPLAARALIAVTGLPSDTALLLTAQFACVGFWIYFLLLLRRWGTPPLASAACVALVAGHPSAFFMVCSYSESLFLMALMGFVYWSGRTGPLAAVLAALHGIAMTAARLVGIPVAAYPILLAWARRARARGYLAAFLVAGVAALGATAYVVFLRVNYDRWDVLSASQLAGWNVRPDAFALFRERTWALRYAEIVNVWRDVEALNRLIVPLTVLHFLLLGGLEILARRGGRPTRWRGRVPLYAAAFGLFIVPVMAHASRGMSSMMRFSLCWDAVLVLALSGVLADRPDWARKPGVLAVLFGGAIWFASIQPMLAIKFAHGEFAG